MEWEAAKHAKVDAAQRAKLADEVVSLEAARAVHAAASVSNSPAPQRGQAADALPAFRVPTPNKVGMSSAIESWMQMQSAIEHVARGTGV